MVILWNLNIIFIAFLQVSSSGAKATDRWNLTCGRYTSGRRSRCSPPTSWSSCLCCCSPGGAIIRNSCSQIEIVEILPHSRLWAERQHWRHCGRARAEFSSTRSCWSPTAWPTCPRCSSPASYPLCPDRHPENEQFSIEFPPNISITPRQQSLASVLPRGRGIDQCCSDVLYRWRKIQGECHVMDWHVWATIQREIHPSISNLVKKVQLILFTCPLLLYEYKTSPPVPVIYQADIKS